MQAMNLTLFEAMNHSNYIKQCSMP